MNIVDPFHAWPHAYARRRCLLKLVRVKGSLLADTHCRYPMTSWNDLHLRTLKNSRRGKTPATWGLVFNTLPLDSLHAEQGFLRFRTSQPQPSVASIRYFLVQTICVDLLEAGYGGVLKQRCWDPR